MYVGAIEKQIAFFGELFVAEQNMRSKEAAIAAFQIELSKAQLNFNHEVNHLSDRFLNAISSENELYKAAVLLQCHKDGREFSYNYVGNSVLKTEKLKIIGNIATGIEVVSSDLTGRKPLPVVSLKLSNVKTSSNDLPTSTLKLRTAMTIDSPPQGLQVGMRTVDKQEITGTTQSRIYESIYLPVGRTAILSSHIRTFDGVTELFEPVENTVKPNRIEILHDGFVHTPGPRAGFNYLACNVSDPIKYSTIKFSEGSSNSLNIGQTSCATALDYIEQRLRQNADPVDHLAFTKGAQYIHQLLEQSKA